MRAVEGVAIVMLVDQVEQFVARGRDDRPEGDPRDLAGRNRNPLAQREDRVEHGPDGVRKRRAVDDGRRRRRCCGRGRGSGHGRTRIAGRRRSRLRPRRNGPPRFRRLVGRAPAPRRDQRPELRQIFGLHEHLGEGRMCVVGRGRRQHEFGVGGQFDLARAPSAVDQRHAAHFAVVLAGDDNIQRRRQRAVATDELGVVLAEDDFVPGRRRRASAPRRPTRPLRFAYRAGRRTSPSRRGSHPRASASRRYRASGCSPLPWRSA